VKRRKKMKMKNKNNINIIRAIVLSALAMLLSLFFFIPYVLEQSMIDTITKNAKNTVKQIKLTRAYYVDSVVKEIKADPSIKLSFSHNHKGVNGVLPLPTTLVHDLSEIFSENLGISYDFYSEYPFKNRESRVLSTFQKEAIKFTKKTPDGVYIKREILNGEEVLRVATTDFMTKKSCVSCHNSHPDRTWEEGYWKLGDKRGIIEVITPITPALLKNNEIRDYILLLLFIISTIVLFLLSRVLLKNEKSLKKEIISKSDELETLSSFINDKMISSKINIEGKITYVSQAFIDISGYERDELIGKPFGLLRHPNMDESIYDQLWGRLKRGESWSGDLLKRAKDGSSYYVHTTAFPIFDRHNRVIGYTSFSEDISEKVAIEKKLEEERVFKQTIFDNQDEIIFISSFNEGIININKKFFNVFDFKNLDDFHKKHRTVGELFINKDGYLKLQPEGAYWSDIVLNEPRTIHKVLMLNRYKEKRVFRVRIKEIVITDEKYHITTFSNITELEKARELAESSERAKAAFMANMSHELRTPLNGIDGFIQLLAKSELDEKQHKYISLIRSSSANLIGIVNDILDFSKIESGKMTLSCIEVNPFVEFKNILELFNAKTLEKNIQYITKIDEKIPSLIMIDKLRISQVLSNLISNAIKFTDIDGSIKVEIALSSIEEEHLELKFSVKDSGIGIPKNRQKAIFEAFSQADESTTREFGGTGLGLSISVSLVELMQGRFTLESEEGKGSTFTFTIKVKKVSEEKISKVVELESRKRSEELNSIETRKLEKILVVEDNEMNQILMEELLKPYGLEVDFANNGEEAIEKVEKTNGYNLIFMDINMPILNGIDTSKIIRDRGYTMPIIALTANALEGDEEKFLSLGMSDYLSKPINYEIFEKMMQKYVK